MNPAQATAITNASRELLGKGDAEGAERILSPAIASLRSDPVVLHLMGLIKKAQNQLTEAERFFRGAIAISLSEGAYYNDLGVVLQARGQYEEAVKIFRAAMALVPEASRVRANLVRCLLAANDLQQAEREARAYLAAEPGAEAWTLLGHVQRAQERHEEALASAEHAAKLDPSSRRMRYNLAVALERLGRGGEALEHYEQLAKQDLESPELALSYIRGLYAAGRKKDAESVAEQAVQLWAGSTALQSALSRIRWLRGEGENCTAIAEAELLWRRPSDLALRLACADVLHRAGHPQKAMQTIEEALRYAPTSPGLLSGLGMLLDELDRPIDALKALRRALELSQNDRAGRRNLLSTLLRAGQPKEALEIARDLRTDDPDEQYLIACEATALRLLDDPGYRVLCDFERMVRRYTVTPPQGYFTAESFNASLADFLRMQHRTNAHPLDQPHPNFSQTSRSLLAAHEPVMKAFLSSIEGAVREYIARLPEGGADPVSRRRTRQYRFTNMWSVRLMKEGHQPAHVHDRGWISGVYTVALMPEEKPRDPKEGWLKLGEPNRAPRDCGPERLLEPRVGELVLFPSYFWQAVNQIEGAERLSIGFTVGPA